MIGMLIEIIEHRGGGDESAECEDKRMLPVAGEETFVGEEKYRQERDHDEWCESESDVSVDSGPEEQSGEEEIAQTVGSEALEEEVEGKSKEKCHHDRPEADPREIDRPVARGEEEGRDRGIEPPGIELFRQEVDAEDSERTEHDRPEFQDGYGIAEVFNGQGLEIDEESFPAVVVRIEELVVAGFIGEERVSSVGRFVRIESGRQ